jgi:hypothetical protein
MTLLLTALLLVPMIGLAASLTDAVMNLVELIRAAIEASDGRPPAWLKEIPLVGGDIDAYVRKLTHSHDEMRKLGLQAVEPARKLRWAGRHARPGPAADLAGAVHRVLHLPRRRAHLGPARDRRRAPGRRGSCSSWPATPSRR